MELCLRKSSHEYCEKVEFPCFTAEITKESIVPDSNSDIARIVETTGHACLTGRELTGDGRICAGGIVEAYVMYIPEKGEGPCSLRVDLPFQSGCDLDMEFEPMFPDVICCLQGLEARVLNPRKILLRANLCFYVSVCRKNTITIAEDVHDCAHVQLLREVRENRALVSVREREFSFSEEVAVSPGRTGVKEILAARAALQTTDCKLIGAKLVLKGMAMLTVLYREEGGRVASLQQELPFSQLLDGAGADESWETDVALTLLGLHCSIGTDTSPGDPHMLSVTVRLRGRVHLWQDQQVASVTDMYSTKTELRCATVQFPIREHYQRYNRRQNVRALLESSTEVQTLLDLQVKCCDSPVLPEGDCLETVISARCLYTDDNGVLHALHREVPVSFQVQIPTGHRIEAVPSVGADLTGSILPEGVELRFPVEWSLEQYAFCSHCCIAEAEIDPEQEGNFDTLPSLVLRRAARGEDLWSIAKQYRTTCEAILETNELAPGSELPLDRMLLIPRCK